MVDFTGRCPKTAGLQGGLSGPSPSQGGREVLPSMQGERGLEVKSPSGSRASPKTWSRTSLRSAALRQITQHPLPATVSPSAKLARHTSSPPHPRRGRRAPVRPRTHLRLQEQFRTELGSGGWCGEGPSGLDGRSPGFRAGLCTGSLGAVLTRRSFSGSRDSVGSCHLPGPLLGARDTAGRRKAGSVPPGNHTRRGEGAR